MDCFEVKEKLFAYLDGEMQEDVETIEAHFKYCIDCYKRATLERAFIKVIRARASGKPVPRSLEQHIREEISARSGSRSWTSPRKSSLFLLAAAALMVTTVGFTAFRGSALHPPGLQAPPGPVTAARQPAAQAVAATASDRSALPPGVQVPVVATTSDRSALPPGVQVPVVATTSDRSALPATAETRLATTPIARALLQPTAGVGAGLIQTTGSLDGRLVCIHCAMGREGARIDPHEHCNGIQTEDGKIWHILETELTTELMHDNTKSGKTLHVDGLINVPAQTIAVNHYHY